MNVYSRLDPSQGPCLLTGATGAIGREIALTLSRAGVPLILGVRNPAKADALLRTLGGGAELLELDLAREESVCAAAASLRGRQLGAIVNNAGVMMRRYTTAPGGVEMTMTVNYHHTRLLTELLKGEVRDGGAVVFTTSLTRFAGPLLGRSLEVDGRRFSQLGTYALSKRALTDYARLLAASEPRLRVNCADPGVVNTGMIGMQRWYDPLADIFFRPLIRTPRHGAIPALRALTAEGSGRIYCRRAIHRL